MGKQAASEYESAYNDLIDYFKKHDPLYLCAFCLYYFSMHEEGIDEEAINGCIEFPPFFVEVLQCISLKFKRNLSANLLNEKVENFKSTIINLNRNQSFSHLKLIENAKSEEDLGAIQLSTEMMGHTLAVRNWAYVDQMETIAHELADLVEQNFINHFKFNPHDFLDILFELAILTEEKLNIHRRKTISFLKQNKINKVFDKYEESFPHIEKTNKSKREEIWEMTNKSLDNLKASMLAHSDLFLTNIFTHNLEDIYNHFSKEISKKEISIILESLSLSFGDLSDINKDHIFLNNPIHYKPLIKISNKEYFSVIPHMFSHLGVDLFESLISQNAKLQKKYSIKKGKFLEDNVEILLKKSFPKGQIFKGSLWDCPTENKQFENDLIVLIEDFALIIECKSGTISPPARRGATGRLFKTIKELVIDPSEQAIRFEKFLKQNPKNHIFQTKCGKKNKINSAKIKYYVPLGVTLSNLGSIGCNLKKLINAKISTNTIDQLAPSISYTDLEIIFEILPLQAEKIHYLSRRREFEAHLFFHGDEMDLFGFYLDNGFNIGETEFDKSNFIDLTLKSKDIDPYFIGRSRGVNVKKPTLQKTKLWHDTLNKLEQNARHWLMSSYILLNLPLEDQIKYEKGLKKLINNIKSGKCQQKHNYMIMTFGPTRRKFAITGYPYEEIDRETRNAIINDIIASMQENNNVRGVLVLGYDLKFKHYPYSVVAGSYKTDLFDKLELSHN
nr:hypothetical protein [uncultured Marinifilum sp.]